MPKHPPCTMAAPGDTRCPVQAWQEHTASLRTIRAAVEDRHSAESAILLRLTLRSWNKHTSQRRAHRMHVLEKCITKQVDNLQVLAFSAWRQYVQVRKVCQHAAVL